MKAPNFKGFILGTEHAERTEYTDETYLLRICEKNKQRRQCIPQNPRLNNEIRKIYILGTEHAERTEYTDLYFMLIHEELTKGILAAFYEVHHTLGFGFLENVYQNALYNELTKRGYKCECQKDITVYYKGEIVGLFRADMVVNDIVILELKAVSDLRPEHEWQLVNYLKATGIEVGLLLNFGVSAQHKRKIFTKGYIKRI